LINFKQQTFFFSWSTCRNGSFPPMYVLKYTNTRALAAFDTWKEACQFNGYMTGKTKQNSRLVTIIFHMRNEGSQFPISHEFLLNTFRNYEREVIRGNKEKNNSFLFLCGFSHFFREYTVEIRWFFSNRFSLLRAKGVESKNHLLFKSVDLQSLNFHRDGQVDRLHFDSLEGDQWRPMCTCDNFKMLKLCWVFDYNLT